MYPRFPKDPLNPWRPGVAETTETAGIGYRQCMVFDFRYKSVSGQWKSSGHRKGDTRDAAFAALEAKNGPMPAGKYMSRPRDGRTKNWDLFTRP
jgi:hypothetical protein